MIVVDSSAVLAIAFQEPEARTFAAIIDQDDAPQISAATILECSIVLRSRRGVPAEIAEAWLDDFLIDSDMTIRSVTSAQTTLARRAHMRFGKGTGHSAQLNYGDCFSYALARESNAPLLYKGNDFAQTDIVSAV